MHRSRVVRKIVENGDTIGDANRLEPPFDTFERAQTLCQCFSRQAEIRADTNRGERVPNVVLAEQRRLKTTEDIVLAPHRESRLTVAVLNVLRTPRGFSPKAECFDRTDGRAAQCLRMRTVGSQ